MTYNIPIAPPPPPAPIKMVVVDHDGRTPSEAEEFQRRRRAYRFSINELSSMYNVSRPTLNKMFGNIRTAPSNGERGTFYDIKDVTMLVDVRNAKGLLDAEDQPLKFDDDGKPIDITNPTQMRLFYQAKDVEQAYLIKKMKNDIASRQLLPADEVEKLVAQAFKGVATFIDNLPDILERTGIIENSDIERVIDMTDKIRNQLADDMMAIGDPDPGAFEDDFDDTEE